MHRFACIFVPCIQQHVQQVLKFLITLLSGIDNITNNVSGAFCPFQILPYFSGEPKPPALMRLTQIFDYKCLNLVNEIIECIPGFLRNINVEKRIDYNLKRKLMHEWVNINLACGECQKKVINCFFDDRIQCMNFIRVKPGLNQSPLLKPVITVYGKQSLS